MQILILDNYDSFTHNLAYLLTELGHKPVVIRNDKLGVEEVAAFDKILLSPGPGIPDEAGITKQVIRELGPEKSILGVCLGHQTIAEVYNASIYNLTEVLHGVTSVVNVVDADERLFADIPNKLKACHYHSWAVDPGSINGVLKVTAVNEQGLVMAISHQRFDVKGVQFHPESILTEHGKQILKNWIST